MNGRSSTRGGDGIPELETLVFCDDAMLAETDNVWQSLHHPLKHEANPVLEADRPWEGYVVLQPGTVVYDEQNECFQMWYNSQPSRDKPDVGHYLCYATSVDGLHWEKLKKGLRRSLWQRPLCGMTTSSGSSKRRLIAWCGCCSNAVFLMRRRGMLSRSRSRC